MSKRFLSGSLAVCMLLVILFSVPLYVHASMYIGGERTYGDWEYNIAGFIIDYNGKATSLTVPTELEGWPINKISLCAFQDCDTLKKVIIPAQITTVSSGAFINCDNLECIVFEGTYVKFPSGGVFADCPKLKEIVLPPSIGETIPSRLFANCISLESVSIPSNIREIKEQAFQNCTSLESISSLPNIREIGKSAFENCSSLKSISLGSSVKTIDKQAFAGCSSLDGIWVDNSNPYFCSDSKGVLFNKEMTKLLAAPGSLAGSYVIPDTVTSMGHYAFTGCKNLESVSIPRSIGGIMQYQFHDCSGLKDIYFFGCPRFYDEPFTGVIANAHYVPYAGGWTEEKLIDHGGALTWIPMDVPFDIAFPTIQFSNHTSTGYPLLNWVPVTGASSYDIYRASSENGPFERIGTTSACTYTDISSELNTEYFYKAVAFDANGNRSQYGDVVEGSRRLPQPTITAEYDAATGTVQLKWDPIEDARDYTISRATSPNAPEKDYESLTYTDGLSCTDTNVEQGAVYYYIVRARSGRYESWSAFSKPAAVVCSHIPFTDVKADRFADAILWAVDNGITSGTGDGTTFSPEAPCTRKQIVTFLWRAAGCPEPKNSKNPFTDVKSDRFEQAILWAYYEGITSGTTATTFSPENPCTRKQIVTFLYRSEGK